MDITQLKKNERAKVVALEGGCGMVRKLEVMGITPGVEIVKTSSQFLGGPVILSVRRTKVAVGHGMAKRIIVEPL